MSNLPEKMFNDLLDKITREGHSNIGKEFVNTHALHEKYEQAVKDSHKLPEPYGWETKEGEILHSVADVHDYEKTYNATAWPVWDEDALSSMGLYYPGPTTITKQEAKKQIEDPDREPPVDDQVSPMRTTTLIIFSKDDNSVHAFNDMYRYNWKNSYTYTLEHSQAVTLANEVNEFNGYHKYAHIDLKIIEEN